MAEITLNKMVQTMANASSPSPDNGWTLNWNVVVSYSEKDINQVLYKAWEKHKDQMLAKVHAVAEIPPDSDEEDDDQDDGDGSDGGREKRRTRIYDVELGAPCVEFSGEATLPAVHLKFPLKTGSYCRSDDLEKKSHLPENGYVFTIRNIPLGTVTGTYEEVKNKDDLDIKGDCVFKKRPENTKEDDYEVSWVVMDFKLSGKDLNVQVEKSYGDDPTPKRKKAINHKFSRAKEFAEAFFLGTSEGDFQNRFRVIRHALATVKNKDLPRQSGVTVDLTPKSFRLATCASDSIVKGSILSLFIHVVDGKDAGEKRDLQTRWRGQWVSVSPKIPPIPAPYTASILIHPALLFEKVIKNSVLTNTGEQGWQINRLTGVAGGGIAFHATWPKTIDQKTFYIKLPQEDPEWREKIAGAPYLEVEGWEKDLTQTPATIHLYQQDFKSQPVAHVEWEFSVESQWQKLYRYASGRNNELSRGEKMNTMKNKTTFSIDYKFPLVSKMTDYDVTFRIDGKEIEDKSSMKDDWLHWKSHGFIPILEDLEQELQRLGSGIFGGQNVAGTNALKKRHEKMREVLPKFNFGTIGLGFFLTTNLLNPGAQLIDVDKKAGMRLPGNMIVVGKVVQGEDKEKKARG